MSKKPAKIATFSCLCSVNCLVGVNFDVYIQCFLAIYIHVTMYMFTHYCTSGRVVEVTIRPMQKPRNEYSPVLPDCTSYIHWLCMTVTDSNGRHDPEVL